MLKPKHLAALLLLALATLFTFAPAPALAQGMNICDRTQAVEDAILAAITPTPACTSVSAGELATITTLDLRSMGIDTLASGDFVGLSALANLGLADNPFTPGTGLPAGIFDDVLDTLGVVALSGGTGLAVDNVGRAAHFVCSHDDANAIIAATLGTPHCLRITTTQFNEALQRMDATLSGLTLSAGTLEPTFDSGTTSYTASVANSVTRVTVTPTAGSNSALVRVNGTIAVATIDLEPPGTATPITIVVTAATNAMMTYTVDVTRAAVPAAALAGTLTEANLFAATAPTVTVTLANTEYAATGTLTQSHFTVADTIAGTVGISGFTRDSSTVATLTLEHSGEDITTAGTLSVTLAAAGHTGSGVLTTSTIPITASTGTNVCGRTALVHEEIVTRSTASECTSITDLATIGTLDFTQMNPGGGLTAVVSGDFAGLAGLETLLFLRNSLTTLPEDIFAGLSALTTLRFNQNTLRTLPEGVFAGLSSLVELNLFSNNLNTLPVGVFAGLTSVERLYINNNAFTSLPADIFDDGLTSLMDLALHGNPFTAGTGLPVGIFDEVLDTLRDVALGGSDGLAVDLVGRAAHFVCSRTDVAAIVTFTSAAHCLRVTAAELNTYLAMTDATLSGLTLSAGTLDPAFDSATTTYTVAVANSVASVTVTPTATNAGATIAVNGGIATTAIDLPPTGTAVPIAIVVTAADTATRMTYTVTATRAMATTTPAAALAGTLTEANLFAATAPTVTVTLANTEYAATGTLAQSHFTVADTVTGTVSVSEFTRDSSTVATLTLEHSGEDITTAGTLSVTLAAAGHTGSGVLTTSTIPITASTGANVCGRTAQVQTVILAASAATECTSITDLATIASLDLERASIATLQSGDFAGLTALTDLNLSFNGLTALDADIFTGLTALTDLNLRNNIIAALDADIFDGLTALMDLRLSNNSMTALPADIFDGLTTLEVLNLASNSFTTLPAGIFAGLMALQGLNLSSNTPLTTLPAGIFDGLTVLQNLALYQNSFTARTGLPAGIFDDVLDTLGIVGELTDTPTPMFIIDTVVRQAHFVCSRSDFAAIVAATAGVTNCLRITTAQLNTYLATIDATLSGLTLSAGTLDPAFDSGITTYTASVANSVTSVTVTPTATNAADATISVNGNTVTSGNASTAINLPTAGTAVPIAIVVTAADTTTRMTYTVTATRAMATPTTPAATLAGTLTEANLFASPSPAPTVTVTLTDTAYVGGGALELGHFTVTDTVAGTVTVRSFTRDSNTVATLMLAYSREDITANGTLSVTLDAAGHTGAGNLATNTIPITASNGVNICGRTAQVQIAILTASAATECTSVTDLATIADLNLTGRSITALQSGDFAGLTGMTELDLSDNNIDTLPTNIFNDLTALETLFFFSNRGLLTLPTGIFAGLTALTELSLISNSFTALPADIFDGLEALAILDLSFNAFTAGTGLPAGIFDDVLNTVTSIGLTGFGVDANVRAAHFVCSRSDFAAIVTATTGVANCIRISSAQLDTYLVTIDATLSGLTLSDGALNPAFDSATTTYTVSVANSVTGVTVTPTATNAGATITVNGGAATTAIGLPMAGTAVPIAIVVTAADTATRMTYTITATRAPAIPTVSGVAFTSTGPYALGEAIEVTVTFSENVIVTDTPAIALNINGVSRAATYTSGSNSANLVFTYTVTAGESDGNGVGINANALSTPGSSSIQNAGGNDADLTHVAVPQNLTHRVDTAAPTLTAATVNGNSMVLTYDENLGSSTPANDAYTITVSSSGTAPTVTGTTISGASATLALSAAVTRGVTVTLSYAPGSTPLQDIAGNDAAALTARSVTNATPAPADTIYTDDDIPTTLNVGDDFSVDFDINHSSVGGSFGNLWQQTTNDCSLAHSINSVGILSFTPLMAQAGMTCNFVVRYEDPATRNIVDTFAFAVGINAQAPTVSGVAFTSTGPYALGEAIEVTVTFSENVTVTGTPAIALTVGATARAAAYTSGSASANLVFAYTVAAGETDADGVSIGANALTTPGSSSIQSAAGNAVLTHDAVAANTDHAVDTAAPTLSGATVNGNSLVLTYNEDLDAASTPDNTAYTIAVSGTGTAPTVTGTTISGTRATLALSAAVTRGLTVMVSYTPGTTPLQDTAGNDAAALTTTSVTNATPEPANTIYTDDVIPATLNVGDDLSVDFDINHGDAFAGISPWRGLTNSCGDGHSINSETGLFTFSVMPAHAEMTCNFSVRFEDRTDSVIDTFTFAIRINTATPAAPVASDGSRTVMEGDSIAINLGVAGTAPVTCATSSPLPGGLTLNATCTITGDVAVDAITNGTLSQVFVITWTATNTAGADTGTYTLTVNAQNSAPTFGGAGIAAQIHAVGISISTVNLPTGSGGDGALSYNISPALPNGLGLNVTPTGNTLTGTPTREQAATTYTYTVSDSDADTATTDTDSVTFTITIVPAVGVTVTPTALTVPENGGTASYTVVLNSQPTANVMIVVASDDSNVATVAPTSLTLTFTTANWNAAQTVTVTGRDDAIDNPPGNARTATVTHTATSADSSYSATDIIDVVVTVTDDDDPPTVAGIVNQVWRIDTLIDPPLPLPAADPTRSSPPLTYALTGPDDMPVETAVPGLTYSGTATTPGTLSGTPTTSGTTALTYSVTDTVGTTRIVFTVRIGALTAERTAQLNQQILPRVLSRLTSVGNHLIAGRVQAAPAASGLAGNPAPGTAGPAVSGESSSGQMPQWLQWLSGGPDEAALSRRLQNLEQFELRDFIDGLSFAAAGERVGMPGVSLYASGDYRRLSDDDDGLDWDGDLYSGQLGIDKRLQHGVLIGVLLSHTRGEFEYNDPGIAADGEYELDITSVHPYIGRTLSNSLDVWMSSGHGVGEAELKDSDGTRSSDLDFNALSAGVSGRLVASDDWIAGGHSELRLRGDASTSRVDFDRTGDGFTDIDSYRLRLLLEASHLRSVATGHVRSGLEAGIRHDGGDGQDGQGLELGGSIEWQHAGGLTLSGRGRVLTLADYDEWGLSGSVRLTPGQGGRGLSFNLSPGYGRDDSGTEQLWQRGVSELSGTDQTAQLRMDGEVGYGMWLLGGTVQPYLGASLLQSGDSRQRMGARLELGRGVQLELEGSRAAAEHRIELQWQWSW